MEKPVRNPTGKQRARRSHEGNQETERLKFSTGHVEMMHLLEKPRKPLVNALPHRAGAGIRKSHDPYHRVAHDLLEHRSKLAVNIGIRMGGFAGKEILVAHF